MSSSTTNDITRWGDDQLHKHKDEDDELYKRKSVEHRCHMKAWKEAEHQRVEEEMRQKVEVEARRRAEMEAKACTEEVAQVQSKQSSVLGPSKSKQPKAAVSGVAEVTKQAGGLAMCYGCFGAGAACKMKMARGSKMQVARGHAVNMVEEAGGGDVTMGWEEEGTDEEQDKKEEDDNEEAEEECDALGALTKILLVVVTEMQDMAADRRCVAAESHAQTEQMLGILEEIWGCLDLEFAPEEPEVGPEEKFNEEKVAEVAKERELEGLEQARGRGG
ncbi:hypothetical protein PAXRUDRAFT_14984 [Paxillus rubicundulus Ve08.2h10]|uniref:Uncharacterized protein n=1 Tax=Paxillus rubicundulus Ve08.2h10 TaxID=930991 RepID=A0A0D0DR21_9AGAM|nr:hypothetical protein PAXRUDRAFT_14984 [Paxillus rubicundulus Ve08.2h10]